MPVPVVFRIIATGAALDDAVEGPTAGGNLIEIYGDGYRVPTEDDTAPTLEVLFAGVRSPRAYAYRSNSIRAIAPPAEMVLNASGTAFEDPETPVDVTIRNLDAAGIPIPGEEVTVPGGYTYRRPAVTYPDDSVLKSIVYRYVYTWQRDVIENVVLTQHTEWAEDPESGANLTAIAGIPAIVLVGPDMPENTFYSTRFITEDERPDGTVVLRRPPRTVDLEFDVVVIDNTESRGLALVESARNFIRSTIYLEVPRGDGSGDVVRYEHDEIESDFSKTSRPNDSNVHAWSGRVVIRGVDIAGAPGFGGVSTRSEARVPKLEDLQIGYEPTDA